MTCSTCPAGRNTGATFTVRLPVAEFVDQSGPRPAIAEAADAPTLPLSVLVVDDNVDSAEMLAMLVGQGGHRTRVAHDGPAAIVAATEFTPEVLLDIGLPGMSGYEVARELRQRHGDRVHLVAITGWGQSDDRRRARDAGFDCHMTKPADFDLVLAYLDAVAHRSQCTGCSKCVSTPLTRAFDRTRLVRSASDDHARPAP
jgi:DNA-binding response OmpR family regulator